MREVTVTVAGAERRVTAPDSWSAKAAQIAGRMYLAPDETSVEQMIDRVVGRIVGWGLGHGYWPNEGKAERFRRRVREACLAQRYAWNTPVWMNVGREDRDEQCWACTPGDTRMLTREGLRRIDEITASGTRGFLTPGGWSAGFAWQTGVREVVTVLLSNGMEITTTPDHRFVVGEELVEAADLAGARVEPWQGNADWEGNDLGIDHEDLLRLGYLHGDGSWQEHAGATAHLGERDGEVEPLFSQHLARGRDRYIVRDHPLLRAAADLGMPRVSLPGRGMPEGVYTLSPAGMGAWLRGLFTANGTIDRQNLIALKTTSLDLAKGVQRCLLALGMRPTLRAHPEQEIQWRNGTYTSKRAYEVRLVDRASREIFAERVGFVQRYKRERLEASIAVPVAEGYPRARHLPSVVEVIPGIEWVPVYDFTVQDPTHVGWANGFAVHNCLILGVEDSMQSIEEGWLVESRTFQGGSGSGVNVSSIRADGEPLAGGDGVGSGPISLWMRPTDAVAGVVRSGGRTRRAAKMVVLNADHPEIEAFVACKAHAEDIARLLQREGYDIAMNGRDSASVPFQNANNSVRVTDDFMRAVEQDLPWALTYRRSGAVAKEISARDLWRQIAEAAWACGDPGIQFHDTTNAWNSCRNDGEIVASNPCQPAWASVLTPSGIRTVGDLSKGDTVWSGSGWTRVVKKWATGVKRVRRYRTAAGSFVGTENHRVFREGERIEVRFAEAIDRCTGPTTNVIGGWDAQAVLDGWVMGDGTIQRTTAAPVLTIGDEDLSAIQQSEVAGLVYPPQATYGTARVARVQTTLSKEEVPHTYLREIPDRYYHGSPQQVRSFLRGLFAANGSALRAGRVTLKATSRALIDRAQEMLSSLGIPSYVTVNPPATIAFSNGDYECRESYDLNITHGRDLFRDLIGFLHPHKAARLDEACERQGRNWQKRTYEILSVEDLGDQPVYDLTVEAEEHSYWTGGLLVSNCSEYLWLNNTVCNLASINLMAYLSDDNELDYRLLRRDVRDLVRSMDILVDLSSYPTKRIEETSKRYRTLGLGFTNLGALLMSLGLAYDSNEGRAMAAGIMAVIQGEAVRTSLRLARELGAYTAYADNAGPQAQVLQRHYSALQGYLRECRGNVGGLEIEAARVWDGLAHRLGSPMRNAQLSVIAPTGTISLLMDCETTGIEPVLAIEATKSLVGGGTMNVGVTECVRRGAMTLGYTDVNTARGWYPSVFQTALGKGASAISPEAHVRMMAAVQPFVSGGISKTVNLPASATVEDVAEIYRLAWKLGCKAIAVFRDGCKAYQPVEATPESGQAASEADAPGSTAGVAAEPVQRAPAPIARATRRKPAGTRPGITHKFQIEDEEFYVTLNAYEDGTPCEVFINGAKHGSALAGWANAFALVYSFALQYGIDPEDLNGKLARMAFEPSGWVVSDEPTPVKRASSPVDYVARWSAAPETRERLASLAGRHPTPAAPSVVVGGGSSALTGTGGLIAAFHPATNSSTGTGGLTQTTSTGACTACGAYALRRAGSCLVCGECGETTGCG